MASYNSSSNIDPLNDTQFVPKDEAKVKFTGELGTLEGSGLDNQQAEEPKLSIPEALRELALKAYKDAMEKKEIESAGLRPCPHCGYCPTCGRPQGIPQNVPIYPTYPYNPGPWYGPIVTSTHCDTKPPSC